jgi:GrpB-like predicted nucleotidyltransferase (UPF0157 family)
MIVIAPYDPTWPAQFTAEAERIRVSFGIQAQRIEHVGSTSVPGLAAKPVIDIQVSVPSLGPRAYLAKRLEGLGYTHFALGDFDLVYPFFKRPAGWPSTHHVHLCVSGSEPERVHIAFRDYLRTHPTVATEYLDLKFKLAAAHDGQSMESQDRYSLAKTEFIGSVLQAALQEQSSSS